jgi:hypothetical protein
LSTPQDRKSAGVNHILLADLDNNGLQEIIFKLHPENSPDHSNTDEIHVYTSSGQPYQNWPYKFSKEYGYENNSIGFRNLMAFDVDGNGMKEVIGFAPKSNPATGYKIGVTMFIWNYDGTLRSGYPLEISDHPLANDISPVMADIDNDGSMEIGFFIDEGLEFKYIELDGTTVPGWPVSFLGQVWANNVSLADINRDGYIETIFGTRCLNGGANYSVNIFRHDGTWMPGWPKVFSDSIGIFSQISIADIDGDHYPDIIANLVAGDIIAWNYSGTLIAGFPKSINMPGINYGLILSPPAIGDIDGDGKANLVITSSVLESRLYVWNLAGDYSQLPLQWPMADHDPRCTLMTEGFNKTIGDYNGNRRSDILWRHSSTGQVYEMPVLGNTVLPGAVIHTEPNPSWQIVNVGDYNGDSKADILWHHSSTGEVYHFLMNGTVIQSINYLYTATDIGWKIQ